MTLQEMSEAAGVACSESPEATLEKAEIGEDDKKWLSAFESAHGRPLRVLHIGNIAGNAYLNAKILRKSGIEADVLCSEYYHIMACPEWEDVDFDGAPAKQNRPDWTTVDLGSYERPRWYVQGPRELCFQYLIARARGQDVVAEQAWRELSYSNLTLSRQKAKYLGLGNTDVLTWRLSKVVVGFKRWTWAAAHPEKVSRQLRRLVGIFLRIMPTWLKGKILSGKEEWNHTAAIDRFVIKGIDVAALMISGVGRAVLILSGRRLDLSSREAAVAKQLIEQFRAVFPNRPDLLSTKDIMPYLMMSDRWRELLSHYDIVQGYATDPIYPLITGARPYVCFEHGTLRDFTMGDNPLHRLTALAYREADHVFVTNGDCLEFAKRLGISNYSAMIHPVDVEQHQRVDEAAAARLRAQFRADVLLFCPLRHDWDIKGTDVHIRALPMIRERVEGKVVMLMANWGGQLKESIALAKKLKCDGNIVWIPPANRERMIQLTHAADAILDQMVLPCFGSTAPQALAAGVPVIMSYKPTSTAWILDEPAPIISAFSPEEVADAVEQALDPKWRRAFKVRAQVWTDRHHSPGRVARDHVRVYRRIFEASRTASAQMAGTGSSEAM